MVIFVEYSRNDGFSADRPQAGHVPDGLRLNVRGPLLPGLMRLPAGQILCAHEDSPVAPYREIAEWGDRQELTFPADPAESPDWANAEAWAVMRHDEPHTSAFWTVTLSCGHVTEVAVANLG